MTDQEGQAFAPLVAYLKSLPFVVLMCLECTRLYRVPVEELVGPPPELRCTHCGQYFVGRDGRELSGAAHDLIESRGGHF